MKQPHNWAFCGCLHTMARSTYTCVQFSAVQGLKNHPIRELPCLSELWSLVSSLPPHRLAIPSHHGPSGKGEVYYASLYTTHLA